MGHWLRSLGLITILVMAVAIPAQAAFIPETGPYTIQYINDNMDGMLVVGDKTFSDFFVSTTSTVGDGIPNYDEINLTGLVDEDTGEYGLLITSGWSAQMGEFVDTTLIFQVTAAEPLLVADMSLAVAGFQASNGAEVSVSEQVYDSPPPFVDPGALLASLSAKYFGEGDDRNQIADHKEFEPNESVWIFKDILVKGGQDPQGYAALSGVFQTFSQIPEPASASLIAIGALLLGRRR